MILNKIWFRVRAECIRVYKQISASAVRHHGSWPGTSVLPRADSIEELATHYGAHAVVRVLGLSIAFGIRRPWSVFAHQFEWLGLAHEGGRHVRMRSSSVRYQLQLVNKLHLPNSTLIITFDLFVRFCPQFSLSELVRHEENGFVFDSPSELAELLCSWFNQFPNNIALINIKEKFNTNLRKFQAQRWNENWNRNALPLFQ